MKGRPGTRESATSGECLRLIELPFHVAAEKTSATLDKRVLEIKLPKAEETKPRQIEVKVQ